MSSFLLARASWQDLWGEFWVERGMSKNTSNISRSINSINLKIDCLTFYWFYNLGVEIFSEREVIEKEGVGEFWKFFCLGGRTWLTLGKERFTWATRGKGKLYRLTVNWTSSKTVVKDFPYTLRAFHWLLQVYSIKQNMHISQELDFLCITLQCHGI